MTGAITKGIVRKFSMEDIQIIPSNPTTIGMSAIQSFEIFYILPNGDYLRLEDTGNEE